MRKGQLYIATIVIVGFVIAGLANLSYTLDLKTRSLYTETSSVPVIKRNVEKEMIINTDMNPLNTSRLNSSINRLKRNAETQQIEVNVTWSNIETPNNCDVDLGKSIIPVNDSKDGRRFNVTVHDPNHIEVNSIFTVCWS